MSEEESEVSEIINELKKLEFKYVCQAANKIIDAIDKHKIPYIKLVNEIDVHKNILLLFEHNAASNRLKYFEKEDSGKSIREFLESYSNSQES